MGTTGVKGYPLGIWKCTHSIFKDFSQGSLYECRLDSSGSPRIYTHNPDCCWAPYWQNKAGKFCYPRSELNFEWVSEGRLGTKELVLTIGCEGQPDRVVVNGVTYIAGVPNEKV